MTKPILYGKGIHSGLSHSDGTAMAKGMDIFTILIES